jgi:hypothetical protein
MIPGHDGNGKHREIVRSGKKALDANASFMMRTGEHDVVKIRTEDARRLGL